MARKFRYRWGRVAATLLLAVTSPLASYSSVAFASTSNTYSAQGHSWTNGQDLGSPDGKMNDIAIGGNGDTQQIPALEIFTPQAANGFGPGSYIYTNVPFIGGPANGNASYAQMVLNPSTTKYYYTIYDHTTGGSIVADAVTVLFWPTFCVLGVALTVTDGWSTVYVALNSL